MKKKVFIYCVYPKLYEKIKETILEKNFDIVSLESESIINVIVDNYSFECEKNYKNIYLSTQDTMIIERLIHTLNNHSNCIDVSYFCTND